MLSTDSSGLDTQPLTQVTNYGLLSCWQTRNRTLVSQVPGEPTHHCAILPLPGISLSVLILTMLCKGLH